MAYDQRNDRGGSYDRPRERNEFPNSGSMHTRDKKSENAPDMGGNFVISNEVLDYVVREAQNGNEVMLEVSAWRRTARNTNQTFLSLAIQTPWSYRQTQQNPGYRNNDYGRGRSGQSVPDRGRDDKRGQDDMFPGDRPSRGGYADQSGGREPQRGGRYRVDQVPGAGRRDDTPDFMRDEPRQERGRFSGELDDTIPF